LGSEGYFGTGESLMSILDRLVGYARRRSPWLFHLNAGGCNGCDIELLACLSPRYDVEQLGIRLEGSPRHADVLCVSGPVTRNTRAALETIYAQMPEPKVVVALGSCPATGNAFAGSPAVIGPLDGILPVDVYVPGCPPRPDAIIEGIGRAAALLAGRQNGNLLTGPGPEDGRLSDRGDGRQAA
jgi:Ni,Fe-hydrogenase III small subunit